MLTHDVPSYLTHDEDAIPTTREALTNLADSITTITTLYDEGTIHNEDTRNKLREALTDTLTALARVEDYDDETIMVAAFSRKLRGEVA